MDLSCSILRHSGVDVSQLALDGMDLLGHVAERRPDQERTLFFRYQRGQVVRKAVRDGDIKLIVNREGGVEETLLYDLANDPSESTNLAAQRADVVQRLKTRVHAWEEEVQPPPRRRAPALATHEH